MAKMINVDELIEFCNTSLSMLHEHYNSVACAALRGVVEFAKEYAVEAEPVKHGQWLDNPNHSQLYSYICSNCRNSCDWTYRYCPNCGSKNRMGGDGDE